MVKTPNPRTSLQKASEELRKWATNKDKVKQKNNQD